MFLSTETKEKTMMRDIMLIFPILGDGACLYNALAAFLNEDQKQSANLRRMADQFIVMHWWYRKLGNNTFLYHSLNRLELEAVKS